jgi:hypothetical protein
MAAFPDWYCATCGGNVSSFPGNGWSCRCKNPDPPAWDKPEKPKKQRPPIPGERDQYGKRRR